MLNQPERELSKITSKLGLEFDNGMLEYYKKADEVIVGEEKEWKQNLYRPIMNGNVDKWQDELTTDQIKTIEVVLEKEMKALGYQKLSNLPLLQNINNLFLKGIIECMSFIYKIRLN